MSDVFLSYAHEDRSRVEPLARALERESLHVFWDRDEVFSRSGARQTDLELKIASVVIVVLTSGAVTSRSITEEADLALSLGTLLPVWLDQRRAGQSNPFRHIQNLDLVGWEGDASDRRFRHLVEQIRRRIEQRAGDLESSRAAPPPFGTVPAPAPPPSYDVPPFLSQPSPSWQPRPPGPPPPPSFAPAPAPAPSPASQPAPAAVVPPMPQPPAAQPAPAPVASPPPAVAPAAPAIEPVTVDPPSAYLRAGGMQPPDVFVAYSRKDSDTCRQIVSELRGHGLNVFYDQYIQGGEEWRDMLAWNIKNCSVLMVLFTASSKDSPQVRKEVNLATSHSKSIIPVMVEDVRLEGGLELELNGINFIPYFDSPQTRLAEAVEKAKTLAAIAVFERRRQGLQEAPMHPLAMSLGPTAGPVRPPAKALNRLQAVLAFAGAMLLACSGAILITAYAGRGSVELTTAMAVALFFVALPYTITIMLLFNRLLREQ